MEEAKLANTDILTMSLHQSIDGYGVPNLELPFQGKNTTQRIANLRDLHQKIDKFYRDGDIENYETLTTEAYRRLRITWERAVEEVLFQSVILRFRKSIETNRLKGVTVEDIDFHEMNQGMTRCSNFAPHDKAIISGTSTPKPEELLNDILALDSWKDRINKRTTETQKQRKA